MKLLERYLMQVERYLPIKDRKDTTLELKNLLLEDIDNRVDNGQSEEDAEYEVLKNFGNPKEVALKYRNDKPLISREMEPLLYLVLKIVVTAVPLAILLASSIAFLNNGNPFNLLDFILNIFYTIPEMFSAALSGIGMTFIIFALMEKYTKPIILKEMEEQGLLEFDPVNLPKVPNSIAKVSIVESWIAIAGGLLFLYLFNFQSGLIAIYFDGSSVPLLNDNFNSILQIINVGIIFGLSIEVIHLLIRKKTMITSTLELMNKILTSIIFILLATGDVLNQVVIEGYHLEILGILFIIGMVVGAVANFIGGIYVYVKVLIARGGNQEMLKNFKSKH